MQEYTYPRLKIVYAIVSINEYISLTIEHIYIIIICEYQKEMWGMALMRILYVTTIGTTMRFFKPFIRQLLDEGHKVDIATNETESMVPEYYREWGCTVYQIATSRSPVKKGNLMAVKQIRKLVEENKYDIVHCHTPIAAMCTRLACRKLRSKGTKVLYTAHGFHFYKGAPLKNWLLYYPVEKICAHFTDVLITINKEDYALAQKKLKAKCVEYVPGVGIDLQKFCKVTVERAEKRKELGVPEDSILLLSVGELNKNKNHETVIRAITDMNVYYMIAGEGVLHQHLQGVIDSLNVGDKVKLLGFRNDVNQLCEAADAFVFPSFREGLSVSVMEAMANGLPIVCSNIRGNTDLIDENGGVLFEPGDVNSCKAAIEKMLSSEHRQMGKYNMEKVNKFSLQKVNEQMTCIITR